MQYDDGVFKYNEYNNGLEWEVCGLVNTSVVDICIPDYFKGKPVTVIARKAFCGCLNLEHVHIGNNIKEIGNYAFATCYNLKGVTHNCIYLPIAVSCRAFAGCKNLQKVDVNIKSIGAEAFRSCTSLKEIYISGLCVNIEDYAFCGCHNLRKIDFLANPYNEVEIYPHAFEKVGIKELHMNRNVKYSKGSNSSKTCEDYFPLSTLIYCPAWSNMLDLCFVGRAVIVEETCI